MKKSRTLWHIFLLLLYPAAEEVAAASEDALKVAFGAAFSVTCLSEKNGTVPVWSFNGGGELPKEAVVNVNEDEGEVGTVTYSLEVSAANLDNVGEYRDEKYFRWHLQKWFTFFPKIILKIFHLEQIFLTSYVLPSIASVRNEGAPREIPSWRRASSLWSRTLREWPISREMRSW